MNAYYPTKVAKNSRLAYVLASEGTLTNIKRARTGYLALHTSGEVAVTVVVYTLYTFSHSLNPEQPLANVQFVKDRVYENCQHAPRNPLIYVQH